MEARTPESAAVAEAIRVVMESQNLSGADLADRLEEIRGSRPDVMWVSRRRRGLVRLVTPRVVEWEPTQDLIDIARALGVDARHLVEAASNITPTEGPADQ